MLRSLLLTALTAFITIIANAQSTRVTIKVNAAANEPVSFATVTILSVPDTVNQQQRITDSAGTVIFQLEQSRPYRIRVTSINYAQQEKAITIKGDNPVYTFTIQEVGKSLSGVVVTASRPIMRQEDDKTIVDPENLAASSTNAYEIMEKTPGLFVDQDGNVYLNSTTPATIYINGREQKMSAADIATMLKSLPPNAIASIEILRTPSARYDASGSGGIVNVVLKKGVRIGLTGSANAGFNQGRYGNQFIGVNLNNNNGNLSTYLNVQYSRRNNYEQIKTNRLFTPDSLLSQDAFTKYPTNSYYVGFGLGYQFNKKWELSYDGRLNYNSSNNNSNNLSQIQQISTGAIVESNITAVDNEGTNYGINQGLSLKHKMDSLGSEWTTDLSYTYSPNSTDQHFLITYFEPGNFNVIREGDIENKLHFFSAQTNLVKKLSRKLTLEAGLKSTNVRFRNETVYTSLRAYRYSENINAAYLQASKNISGIVIKAGTRVENTNMQGRQLSPRDTSFSIHRTDFFPYVYISRNLMKIAGYDLRAYLVYRRTISRPAYEYLNPSPRQVDQYLYETGNPTLRPQFTTNYEANISVDERPIIAVGYNETKDIFNQVVYQDPNNKSQSFRTYDNLGTNKETYFRALGAIPPGKRYFVVAGLQYNYNFYQGLYEGKPLEFKRGSWTIFTYQTFKIKPLTQLSLNGFARFKGQQQFYELSTFGALNMSLTQQLLDKKLTVTLSANDIFKTNKNDFILRQGTVNANGFREGDTRRFGMNLRYNFGFRKREEGNNFFNVESPEGK
jgi:iron complex outermembrane receptor protein